MAKFTPQFLDELRARLRASDVIGRTVKLKKEGREYRGLSPFTSEKTPSFFVNDEKGRYFDFSSGKSGDIIGFLMDTANLSFPEAVTQLADQAGLEIPKETPEEAQRAERAKDLAEACLEAAKFFRTMLSRQVGEEAAAYLDRRGVPDTARRAFGLGFAPDSKTALKDHLINKDFSLETLVEAGLLIQPEGGGVPYDRFRNRLMFPILGPRTRVIAFGGRALDKTAKAKYLNSPETPLFHKSNTLYNLDRARKIAARTKHAVIVAEGYMDVIALDRAGLPAVAPLGTALTPHQLSLLWRSEDTPLLCFDGDRAGRSAAHRAIDRALPLLKPGKSLGFVFLPDGQDPDDIVREGGAAAIAPLLSAPHPLADVVWDRESAAEPGETPESAAKFRANLRTLVGEITDKDVQHAYGQFFAKKLSDADGGEPAALAPAPPVPPAPTYPDAPPMGYASSSQQGSSGKGGRYDRRGQPPVTASPALKARLAQQRPAQAQPGQTASREAVIVVAVLHHPGLFSLHEETMLELEISDPGLSALWGALIAVLMADPDLDREGVATHILSSPEFRKTYEQWSNHPLIRVAQFAKADASLEDAEKGWRNALSIDRHHRDLLSDVAEAAAEAFQDPGRERTWFDAVRHRATSVVDTSSDDRRGDQLPDA